jgi:hypothetical protein
MKPQFSDKPQQIAALSTSPQLSVQYARRTLRMHSLSEAELDAVASLSNSIHLAFLGMSLGSFVAFAIVLVTVEIHDSRLYASFVSLAWLSAVLSLYFGVRSIGEYFTARRKLREIKGGR